MIDGVRTRRTCPRGVGVVAAGGVGRDGDETATKTPTFPQLLTLAIALELRRGGEGSGVSLTEAVGVEEPEGVKGGGGGLTGLGLGFASE